MTPKKWAITYAVAGVMDLITTIVAVDMLKIAREGNPYMAQFIGKPEFVIYKLVGTAILAGIVYILLAYRDGQLPKWVVGGPQWLVKGMVLFQVLIVVNNAIVLLIGSVLK